jgi:hypothetical protein
VTNRISPGATARDRVVIVSAGDVTLPSAMAASKHQGID